MQNNASHAILIITGGIKMTTMQTPHADTLMEIREANLSYLMLAQQMIRSDKPSAIFRLGVSTDIANFLEYLSNSQLIKLASSSMMLARFRFDDSTVLGMLTNYNKNEVQARAHSAILMTGQAVEMVN
jgi:flagellar transcriptional activator FlhD